MRPPRKPRQDIQRRRIKSAKRRRKPSLLQEIIKWFQIKRIRDREPDATIRIQSAQRMNYIGVLLTLVFIFLVVRAAQIMLLPDPKIEQQAQKQFEKAKEIHGRRGDILDRNKEILATSVSLWNLNLNPSGIREEDISELTQRLSELFDIDQNRLEQRIRKQKQKKLLRVLQKNHRSPLRLDPSERSALIETMDKLLEEHKQVGDNGYKYTHRAIEFEESQYRFYPNRADAAPVLGWLNRENEGVGGIEQLYEQILKGKHHRFVSIRDRRNNDLYPMLEQSMPKGHDGQSLSLTLDRIIQHATDEAVKEGIEATGAKAGFAVVIEVKTGEILAISNQPTINLNKRSELNVDLLKNHAAVYAYEPGSVVKPLIAAAAIEEGNHTPNTIINCENGRWNVKGGPIRDDKPRAFLSLSDVIKFSSNIGIGKVAKALGPKKSLGYLRHFGLGEYPNVRFPGTPKGVVRSPKTIKEVELITTSYGYGANATLLQIVSAFATLGNNGMRMKNLLVKERLNSEKDILERKKPEELLRVVSEESARATIKMLESVVADGTGKFAQVEGFSVAGKTGTAKKVIPKEGRYSETDRIGSFIGLIPADDPVVAIGVSIDTPTIGKAYGGVVAAPVFSKIALATMRNLGIPADPDLSMETPRTEVIAKNQRKREIPNIKWEKGKRLAVPDLYGLSLRDALTVLSAANLKIRFAGSGRVKTQLPPAGHSISFDDTVEVVLQR